MEKIEDLLEKIRPQQDTTPIDRVLYFLTPLFLVTGCVFVLGWEFVGDPINCWFPAYYTGFWAEYARDYCFVQNTYFLPMVDAPARNYWELGQQLVHIPKNITDREDRLIGYYQWVGFFLAIEGILFYLPVAIWRGLYAVTGVRVQAICETLTNTENLQIEKRRGNVQKVARFLDQQIGLAKSLRTETRSFLADNKLTLMYLFVKLLFFLNCVLQFIVMKAFLGVDSYFWGFTVLRDVVGGREWKESGHFPRVTMCDFEVRVLGNLHRHTVQCVLMINMFNEKIFLFLWWWFLVIMVLSAFSLLRWIFKTMISQGAQMKIRAYINRADPMSRGMKGTPEHRHRHRIIKDFIADCLRRDGVFLIQLASSNAGDLVSSEVVATMWHGYKARRPIYPPNGGEHPPPPRVRMAEPSAPPKGLDDSGNYPTLPMGSSPRYRGQPPPAYPSHPQSGV